MSLECIFEGFFGENNKYLLRDVFLNKVYKEFGLVFRVRVGLVGFIVFN